MRDEKYDKMKNYYDLKYEKSFFQKSSKSQIKNTINHRKNYSVFDYINTDEKSTVIGEFEVKDQPDYDYLNF